MSSTVIAAHTRIDGALSAEGDLVIEGAVAGDVRASGQLTLGEQARVSGTISARDVRIAGRVLSRVHAEGVVHLLATAEVHCDLEARRLIVDEGAVFEGQVRLLRAAASQGTLPQRAAAPAHDLPPPLTTAKLAPARPAQRAIPALAAPGRRSLHRRGQG